MLHATNEWFRPRLFVGYEEAPPPLDWLGAMALQRPKVTLKALQQAKRTFQEHIPYPTGCRDLKETTMLSSALANSVSTFSCRKPYKEVIG